MINTENAGAVLLILGKTSIILDNCIWFAIVTAVITWYTLQSYKLYLLKSYLKLIMKGGNHLKVDKRSSDYTSEGLV